MGITEQLTDRNMRLSVLVGVDSVPTREGLIAELVRKNMLGEFVPMIAPRSSRGAWSEIVACVVFFETPLLTLVSDLAELTSTRGPQLAGAVCARRGAVFALAALQKSAAFAGQLGEQREARAVCWTPARHYCASSAETGLNLINCQLPKCVGLFPRALLVVPVRTPGHDDLFQLTYIA
jgi:hypothetical protein